MTTMTAPSPGIDWPRLLQLAEILAVPVYRPDAEGDLRRITEPPADTAATMLPDRKEHHARTH